MPSSAAQDAISSKAQADAVSQVRSGLRPEVKVLRSFAEVEAIRETWAGWKVRRDVDIDFCHECMCTGNEFIRPHVIVIYRGGEPDAMLVGRLEEIRFRCRIGYILPSSGNTLLEYAYSHPS